MGGTVGLLVLLLIVQGSFLIPAIGGLRRRGEKVSLRNLESKESLQRQRDDFLANLQQQQQPKDSDPPQSLCAHLPSSRRAPSVRKLWTRYIGAVLGASQHPDDPSFVHEDWTKRLLSEIPPSLVHQTLKGAQLPSSMGRILEIVRRRLHNPNEAPPLRIAVVGGTFAEGEGCEVASVPVPEGSIMANPSFCAWPYRLQGFLNSLVYGPPAAPQQQPPQPQPKRQKWVEITNLSEEGTDTGFMTPLVGNRIYPKQLLPHGPDIIIHAFTRYDYETYGEGSPTNLAQTIEEEMKAFVEAVQSSSSCGKPPPLLIHMDDGTASSSSSWLSSLDNVVVIRYWEAFRRAMEADHHNPRDFAMAGHMAMTWVLAFDMLELALQHCFSLDKKTKAALSSAVAADTTSSCQRQQQEEEKNVLSKCPFGFFAGPQGTVTRVTEFQKYIQPFVVHNRGWEVLSDMSTGWSRKTGLVAVEPKAQIVLAVHQTTQEIRYLHLMTLRSNQEPWNQGKARFRLAILPPNQQQQQQPQQQEAPQETSFEIAAYHDKDVPVTYHFSLDFEQHKAPVGSDVMLSIELVEGQSFKVLGLMLCS